MWLLCLGVAPISEPRVLDDPPEALLRHVREAAEAPKEPRDDYGGLGPVTRPPAREQRPHAEQRHVVLQHPALVAMAGEARAREDLSSFGVAIGLVGSPIYGKPNPNPFCCDERTRRKSEGGGGVYSGLQEVYL